MEVHSNRYFYLLLLSGKYVIENHIRFAQEAEMHVHKNDELDHSHVGPDKES